MAAVESRHRFRGPAGDEHRRSFLVHTYEIDPDGRLAPRALCAYLQEAAGEDAARLGVSMTRLMEDRLAWVLQRLRLEVSRYPRGGETLTVTEFRFPCLRAIAATLPAKIPMARTSSDVSPGSPTMK